MSVDYHEQKQYWEGIKRRRNPSHPVVKEFAGSKVQMIHEALPASSEDLTMLEVGAGNGYFSAQLNHFFDLIALDFSDNMLAMNPLPGDQKIQGDAEALPYEDDAFDVVFCGNLLHHLVEPIKAVNEMKRVAKSHVVLVEPNSLNPLNLAFGLIVKEERGSVKFTPGYTKALGKRAGLKLRKFATMGVVLPNKMPRFALSLAKPFERLNTPMGFYNVAIFDV